MSMKPLISYFKRGTRSLKSQLALYFIPATLLPVIGLSYYATHIFEQSSRRNLYQQALSESSLILDDLEKIEKVTASQIRKIGSLPVVVKTLKNKNSKALEQMLNGFRVQGRLRLYSPEGDFLAEGSGPESLRPRIHFIPRESLKRIRQQNFTLDRYFSEDGSGMWILGRVLIQDEERLYGVLEQEYLFGGTHLRDIRNQREVEALILKRDFSQAISGIAMGQSEIKKISSSVLNHQTNGATVFHPVWLGEVRYASYLFDLPDVSGKKRDWGFLAILVPLSTSDSATRQLRMNIIYLTVILAVVFGYLIFIFSKRVVLPIETLVAAMKRVKTGHLEELPSAESNYEIEYLIQAFNDMIRNVSVARRTLETKIQELKKANNEIKETQTTLVQSAKMISLGQIVAGVAHELNNPVAFIYSNMHHLSTYLDKMTRLVSEYRNKKTLLPDSAKSELENLEKELDIDFILGDITELTKSCLDGANRTKDIVLGLRTFSRMEESEFRPWDIHEGISSTLRLLNAELKNRITVHQVFGELPKIECSPSQLNQVFMNLLANAIQAIPGKGQIWIRTRSLGDQVEIEIEDTGSGMSEDTLSHIFVPFFTTKKVGEGTGLGLSIAYGLVQKHQGKIEVQSSVGKGTLFRISLPTTQTQQKVG